MPSNSQVKLKAQDILKLLNYFEQARKITFQYIAIVFLTVGAQMS